MTGGRVSLEQPLQAVTVPGGTVTFSVRTGATVRFFVGRLDASGITGNVHTGTATGPAAGSFTLKYAPVRRGPVPYARVPLPPMASRSARGRGSPAFRIFCCAS